MTATATGQPVGYLAQWVGKLYSLFLGRTLRIGQSCYCIIQNYLLFSYTYMDLGLALELHTTIPHTGVVRRPRCYGHFVLDHRLSNSDWGKTMAVRRLILFVALAVCLAVAGPAWAGTLTFHGNSGGM